MRILLVSVALVIGSACLNDEGLDEDWVGTSQHEVLGVTCFFDDFMVADGGDVDPSPGDPVQFQPGVTITDINTTLVSIAATANSATVVIPNGTYEGRLILPIRDDAKTGWITITSCAATTVYAPTSCPGMSDPPSPSLSKRRVRTTDTLPIFRPSASDLPVIENATGTSSTSAHRWRIVGLAVEATGTHTTDLVRVARGSATQRFARHIKLDRVFIHGSANIAVKRGVLMSGQYMTVVRSRITNIHRSGAESQAIAAVEGSGPYTFADNYLAAAGENILIGGGDVLSNRSTDIPSSVRIYGNHLHKPDSWRAKTWQEKNLLEFKNVNGADVYQNTLEGSWFDPTGQRGFAVLFTPRNTGAGTPPDDTFTTVRHVKFRGNKVKRAAGGINVLGSDDLAESDITACIEITDNLFTDIGGVTSTVANAEIDSTAFSFDHPTTPPRWIQVIAGPDPTTHDNGVSDLTVQHNTARQSNQIMFAARSDGATLSLNEDVVFLDNIADLGDGVLGDGTSTMNSTFSTFWSGTISNSINGILGSNPGGFPSGTVFDSADNVFGSGGSNFPRVVDGSRFDNACSHTTHDLGVQDFTMLSKADAAVDSNPL